MLEAWRIHEPTSGLPDGEPRAPLLAPLSREITWQPEAALSNHVALDVGAACARLAVALAPTNRTVRGRSNELFLLPLLRALEQRRHEEHGTEAIRILGRPHFAKFLVDDGILEQVELLLGAAVLSRYRTQEVARGDRLGAKRFDPFLVGNAVTCALPGLVCSQEGPDLFAEGVVLPTKIQIHCDLDRAGNSSHPPRRAVHSISVQPHRGR